MRHATAVGGGLSATGGFAAGAFSASLLCGPGTPVCASAVGVGVVSSVAISYTWGKLQPYIFEFVGFNSERNLESLP